MEMQLYQSDEFKSTYSKSRIDQFKAVNPDLQAPFIEHLEVNQARAKTLSSIEAATGLTFDVVYSGQAKNVAAFVDTQTEKAYITLETLSDPTLALHAAHHEKGHLTSGIYQFDPSKFLESDQLDILKTAIGPNFDQVDWVEAFNESKTFQDHGQNSQSGYAAVEVPTGQKLHQLALKKLGKSALDAFATGNQTELENIFKQLANMLILEEHLSQTHQQFTSLFTAASFPQVKSHIFIQ